MIRVLIVDDDSFFRALAKDILTRNGFEVSLACNLEKFAHSVSILGESPDIILFDINLDGNIKGDEILKSYKKSIEKKGISVKPKLVVISSKTDEELKEIAQKCGADGYIKKSSLNLDMGGYIFSERVKSFLK